MNSFRSFRWTSDKRNNGFLEAEIDTPGLYLLWDVDSKGRRTERCCIVLQPEQDRWIQLYVIRDNLDGVEGENAATQIAKRLDAGELIEQIIELQTGEDGQVKYRIRPKAQAQKVKGSGHD